MLIALIRRDESERRPDERAGSENEPDACQTT